MINEVMVMAENDFYEPYEESGDLEPEEDDFFGNFSDEEESD